jgi:hypothetical protein
MLFMLVVGALAFLYVLIQNKTTSEPAVATTNN